MSRDFLDYIEDILDAMEKAEVMLESVEFERFEADYRINFVVVRALEIIGEAAKRVPNPYGSSIPKSHGEVWPGCGIVLSTAMIW